MSISPDRLNWAKTTLGALITLEYGKPLKAEDRDGQGYPVYGSAGEVGLHSTPLISRAPVIVVGRKGTAGSVWWSSKPCSVIDTAFYVEEKVELEARFLFLLLDFIDLPALTAQTGVPGLNRDRAYGCAVVIPPRNEQKRIVDVISSVEAYIAALKQQDEVTRTARNAVLHELLNAGGDDWTETSLGEAASINPREAALDQNAPFIPMDAVHVGKRFAQYLEPRGERSGARAKGGDILFARITPCLENGKVAQIPPHVERCGGSTEFIVIRGSALTSPDFLYFWATWSETRARAAGLMTGTTGRQRLSAGDLGALPLLLPPFSEQNRIVETVSAMDKLIYSTEQAIADAQKLRSGLLSSLLSGDHEIPESYDRLLGVA